MLWLKQKLGKHTFYFIYNDDGFPFQVCVEILVEDLINSMEVGDYILRCDLYEA